MSNTVPVLNRSQLSEFLKDPRAIRAFENLFISVTATIPDSVDSAQYSGDSFQGQISEVVSNLAELAAIILSQPSNTPQNIEQTFEQTFEQTQSQQDIYTPPVVIDNDNRNPKALVTSGVTLNNFAGAATATLTNAPTAGNPTKWVAINDNGVTRYIPTW